MKIKTILIKTTRANGDFIMNLSLSVLMKYTVSQKRPTFGLL